MQNKFISFWDFNYLKKIKTRKEYKLIVVAFDLWDYTGPFCLSFSGLFKYLQSESIILYSEKKFMFSVHNWECIVYIRLNVC